MSITSMGHLRRSRSNAPWLRLALDLLSISPGNITPANHIPNNAIFLRLYLWTLSLVFSLSLQCISMAFSLLITLAMHLIGVLITVLIRSHTHALSRIFNGIHPLSHITDQSLLSNARRANTYLSASLFNTDARTGFIQSTSSSSPTPWSR